MKAAINQIIEITAKEFGVTPMAILGSTKASQIGLARLAAMYCTWMHVADTDKALAANFGKRQAWSIAYARRTVPDLLETNEAFRTAYRNIEANLNL